MSTERTERASLFAQLEGQLFGSALGSFAEHILTLANMSKAETGKETAGTAGPLMHQFYRAISEAVEALMDALVAADYFPELAENRPYRSDVAGLRLEDDEGNVLFEGDRPAGPVTAEELAATPRGRF